MVILQGLACLLLMLPALALGALWVRRALGTPDAHTTLTLGAVAGLSAHITALNALAYLIPPGLAAVALAATEVLAAVLLWRGFAATGQPIFDCGHCAAVARGVWPWVGIIAVLWSWTLLHTGSSDQLFHASVCAPMARSGLPATHPFDTTQVLNYHYALNILAASLGACTGLKSWWALDVVLALLAPMILAGCVEFLRAASAADGREASRAELLYGTLLFALGGNFQWIEWLQGKADPNPANRFGFGCDGIATLFPAPSQAGAWVWLFAVFALVLRWRATQDDQRDGWTSGPGRGLCSASIPLGLMLGVLCLMAEHAAFAVAIALVIFTAWDLRGGLERISSLLIAGALGLGLAVVQGGTITGLALKLSGSGNLKPGWTGEAWPSFPSQLGRVTHLDPGYGSFVWREYGATLYLLPLLLAWGLSRRAPTAVRWLLVATVPCAFVTLYVRFPLNEFDTYRFYQLYLCAALLAVGLFCARVWETRRALAWKCAALLVCLPLIVEGTRATAVWALTFYSNSPWDYPAAQYEAYAEVERRIAALGLHPDPTETRVIAQLPGLNFAGIPTEPGILGRAVPAGDPDTDVTIVRGRAWWNALQCPSPSNLRTARARWVLLNGEDLARTLPILEGCSDFEFIGAYGPDGPERYRLYHYKGNWETKKNTCWQMRQINRVEILNVRLGKVSIGAEETKKLLDGDVESAWKVSAQIADGNSIKISSNLLLYESDHENLCVMILSPNATWKLPPYMNEGIEIAYLKFEPSDDPNAKGKPIFHRLTNDDLGSYFSNDHHYWGYWGSPKIMDKIIYLYIALPIKNVGAPLEISEIYIGTISENLPPPRQGTR